MNDSIYFMIPKYEKYSTPHVLNMNDNITGRKNWYLEGVPGFIQPDGKITVILEEESRRLVSVEFNNINNICHRGKKGRIMYYIQKTYVNPTTGYGHWIDEHYDRSKNKMIRRFKNLI